MDFESPDDYPGIFGTAVSRKSNDSDYSDDVSEKISKKDILGKRKEKKDKKERGYAALEGESSAEEKIDDTSLKSKKSKSFKFSAKHKEKREKVKEREVDKKKGKEKKVERTKEKFKVERKDRKSKYEEKGNIGEALPIFSVSLQLAVERSHCHDGVDLPLPVRECIDYIQEEGVNTENVYKISGVKAKVLQIKKMYNQREPVTLSDYDVPTATSLLKLFFRELPESILEDFNSKFEEVAAIQNVSIREIRFISLIEKLPVHNKTILAWTMLHLDTIVNNQKNTKMNAQGISVILSPVLQMSHRLIIAFLCHCKNLFKDTKLFRYHPPLTSSTMVDLPEEQDDIIVELKKQESLLSQIHMEMNSGFISKEREELLWEVQRMITQLKRKLRSIQKYPESIPKNIEEYHIVDHSQPSTSTASDEDVLQDSAKSEPICSTSKSHVNSVPDIQFMKKSMFPKKESKRVYQRTNALVINNESKKAFQHIETKPLKEPSKIFNRTDAAIIHKEPSKIFTRTNAALLHKEPSKVFVERQDSVHKETLFHNPNYLYDRERKLSTKPLVSRKSINTLQYENNSLLELKSWLLSQIAAEKSEIVFLKYCLSSVDTEEKLDPASLLNIDFKKLDEITDLIKKENRILQIKKTDLIREIMENREACIYFQSKLSVLTNSVES